jgi:hypothetical protein
MLAAESKNDRWERLVESAVEALGAAPHHKLNIVVLNKTLFYADLLSMRDLGHSITRCRYVALPQGPVVEKYDKKLVGALTSRGLAKQLNDGMAKPLELVGEPPESHLISAAEVSIVRQVVAEFDGVTSTKLSNFSHENIGWKCAYESGIGAGEKRPHLVNMMLALQQVLDWTEEDDWLSTPLDHVEQAAVRASWQEAKQWD